MKKKCRKKRLYPVRRLRQHFKRAAYASSPFYSPGQTGKTVRPMKSFRYYRRNEP